MLYLWHLLCFSLVLIISTDNLKCLKYLFPLQFILNRTGHAAIAFRMSRSNQQHTADDCLELGHHILKAHIYKNTPKDVLAPFLPRDLQAYWVNLGTTCLESSIGSLRNVYSPNVKVSYRKISIQ